MSEVLLVEKRDAVTYLTLNRPEKYNALDLEITEKLSLAVKDCFEDDTRVVVIRGSGKAFCSGGDLSYMVSQQSIKEALGKLIQLLHRLMTDIRLLPKPVIAAINGTAAGAGMSLALAADLRIASDRAKFKQAYTSNGLVPDGGWSLWVPAIVGLSKASELILLDEVFDARRAHELGLVNMVAADSDFSLKVDETARMLAKGATKAYGAAKALLNQSALPMLETQLEKERQAMIAIGSTRDAKEGINAFLEKRLPEFCGE